MDPVKATVATFDKYAEQYQDKFMDYPAYTKTYARFASLLTEQHRTLLDVGCGPGNISRYLLAQHPHLKIHGVDLSPRMVELAAKNNPNHSFAVLDTRDIGQLEQTFDVIICGFCLPYLEPAEAKTCLETVYRLLNPNGLLYLSTMVGDPARSGYKENASGDGVITTYYEAKELLQMLSACGFTVCEHFSQNYPADGEEPVEDLFVFALRQ